jgi:Cof subfamily protein (haloacid dehalogenase superfamily)
MMGRMDAPYRLVASDLDGTLLGSGGVLSERSIAAMRALDASDIELVVVTGRPPRWLGVVQELGLHGEAICANGALVCDLATGAVLSYRPMAVESAREVALALRRALPDVVFAVEHEQGFGHEAGYRPRLAVPDDTTVAHVEDLLVAPVTKLLARHDVLDSDALLDVARGAIESLATATHSSRGGLVEISALGVTKATALAGVCADRGVEREQVLAFGDMPNDLPMLEWAGHGVAVANAHPDVLAAADEVTGSNEEDGVAAFLERCFALTP